MNAVLVKDQGHTAIEPTGLRLADDGLRGYSTTPTAHVRDLVADGIKGNGLAVYFAIADRQMSSKGEYFRSNEKLAEETGLSTRTVQRFIRVLKEKKYISVWYVNGGRRIRVCTRVCTKVTPVSPPHDTGVTPPRHQCHPYKENTINKTTQPNNVCVSSLPNLSKEHRALFGEGHISKLVATFGMSRVERGLHAWEATDQKTIRNPVAWFAQAVKDDYEPRTAQRADRAFPQSSFDHDEIIKKYIQKNGKDKCLELSARGLPRNRIAYKIWSGKI
jgi:biotin operon repressor